jgi:hypothetical protein
MGHSDLKKPGSFGFRLFARRHCLPVQLLVSVLADQADVVQHLPQLDDVEVKLAELAPVLYVKIFLDRFFKLNHRYF